jgi:hypothetical protein
MNEKAEDAPEAEVVALTAVAENTTTDDPPQEESSITKVCSWVSFILINIAFIALVLWGSATSWGIGFGFAIAYTIVLMVAGHLLKRKNNGKDSILTSLLFLLAVFAIAVSGLYLPLNVFPCSNVFGYDNYDNDSRDFQWVTETGNLPSDVQSWWANHEDFEPYTTATFVYLNSTGITFFEGTEGGDGSFGESKLWFKEDGRAPEIYYFPSMNGYIPNPRNFVAVDDSTVCFSFLWTEFVIACTNGMEFNFTADTFDYLSYRKGVMYSNDLLWLRAGSPSHMNGWGEVLYSVDPFNLTDVSLISSINENNDEYSDNNCSSEYTTFVRFLSLLGLSALPSLVGAIGIGFAYSIPSMSVGGYLSTTWAVICLVLTIDPRFDSFDSFFGWWFVFTTGPWLILLTLAHLTNRIAKGRLAWGTNFAALVYTIGMFILLAVFSIDKDMFWQWAVLTIFVVPPLFVIGVITRQIFLLVLACIVIMIDVFRLTSYISDVAGLEDSLPVQFVVLGLSGLALGFLGYLLNKRQSRVESAISNWAKSSLGRWVICSDDEVKNDDGVGDF